MEIDIHYNGMDIVQRLMAEKMIGQIPLKALNFTTSEVKEILSTDLPDVQTKNEKADTLDLLEDGTYLHVEFQTTFKKHDSFRFARYVLDLYNKYKDNKGFSSFLFQSVVVFAPPVNRKSVTTVFDIGAIQYKYFPIFLNEVSNEESYIQIIDKIRLNPNVKLTNEEKMVILYRPLFNSDKLEIEKSALLVVGDIQEMADESEKAMITGTLFVLVKKYLSKLGQEKIWEALVKMDIIKEKMEQRDKLFYTELLIEAIQEGDPQRTIERLIKRGKFSKEEIEEIYRKAKDN